MICFLAEAVSEVAVAGRERYLIRDAFPGALAATVIEFQKQRPKREVSEYIGNAVSVARLLAVC